MQDNNIILNPAIIDTQEVQPSIYVINYPEPIKTFTFGTHEYILDTIFEDRFKKLENTIDNLEKRLDDNLVNIKNRVGLNDDQFTINSEKISLFDGLFNNNQMIKSHAESIKILQNEVNVDGKSINDLDSFVDKIDKKLERIDNRLQKNCQDNILFNKRIIGLNKFVSNNNNRLTLLTTCFGDINENNKKQKDEIEQMLKRFQNIVDNHDSRLTKISNCCNDIYNRYNSGINEIKEDVLNFENNRIDKLEREFVRNDKYWQNRFDVLEKQVDAVKDYDDERIKKLELQNNVTLISGQRSMGMTDKIKNILPRGKGIFETIDDLRFKLNVAEKDLELEKIRNDSYNLLLDCKKCKHNKVSSNSREICERCKEDIIKKEIDKLYFTNPNCGISEIYDKLFYNYKFVKEESDDEEESDTEDKTDSDDEPKYLGTIPRFVSDWAHEDEPKKVCVTFECFKCKKIKDYDDGVYEENGTNTIFRSCKECIGKCPKF